MFKSNSNLLVVIVSGEGGIEYGHVGTGGGENFLSGQVKTHPQRYGKCSERSEHFAEIGPPQCLPHEGTAEEGTEEETVPHHGLCRVRHIRSYQNTASRTSSCLVRIMPLLFTAISRRFFPTDGGVEPGFVGLLVIRLHFLTLSLGLPGGWP